jgi:iron complex outermembrane receptor protein
MKFRYLASAAVVILLSPAVAAAQQGDAIAPLASDTSAQDGSDYGNDIIVTARKRDERLQDIPLAVSVFGASDIEDRGFKDMAQISQFTPGLSIERANRYGAQGGVSRPVIRGMSNVSGEGNASIFVDGIPFSDSILSFPLDLVERVEVIKGPQAALYGRSTFSGAINLITKRGSNTPEYRLAGRVAGYGEREIAALARGPIVDDVLYYTAHARKYSFGGQYTNTLDGKRVGQEDSLNFNGSLELHAASNLRISLSGGYARDRDGHAAIAVQDRFSNNCYLDTPRQYYCGAVKVPDSVTLDLAGLDGGEGLRRDSYRAAATLVWDIGGFKITSNTGYFSTDTAFGYDSTYQGATAFGRTTVPNAPGYVRTATDAVRVGSVLRNEVASRDELSTELRVEAPSVGIFEAMVGASYYQRRRPLIEYHFDEPTPDIDSGTDRIDNWALFGSVNAAITPRLDISAELRYAEDKIGNYKTQGDVLVERTFRSWTPRVTANYRLADASILYGSIARGNKPGVINSDPRFPPEVQFADEESSTNFEIGIKNELFGRGLTVNAALFYIDWKKQQLTSSYYFPGGGNRSYIVNAGETEVKGLEIEATGVINNHLTVGGTFAINDARFVAFDDSEARDLFGDPSVAGKQTPNSSKYQATLFGAFTYPISDDVDFSLRADGAYNSRRYAQIFNLAHTGDQYLVNLRAGFETRGLNIALFVNNVTNDRTPSTVVRWIDQLNLNVPQHVNVDPAQDNVAGSTVTERAFQIALPAKRQFGVSVSATF